MKTAILKLSGKLLDDNNNMEILKDMVTEIKSSYDGLVLVHGGGKHITKWCRIHNIEEAFLEGQRITGERTIEIVAAVQAGLLNSRIVSVLQSFGINTVGLTGIDFGLFTAVQLNKELGYAGIPVNRKEPSIIYDLVRLGIIPVFSSLCSDHEGKLINVNADIFTVKLAKAIKAAGVFFISDVDGVRLDGKFRQVIDIKDIEKGFETGQISDGMIPKLQGCRELLEAGIAEVWIGSKISPGAAGKHIPESIQNGTRIVNYKEKQNEYSLRIHTAG